MMLAITGAIYLFKPQIQSFLYQDYYYIEQGKHELSPSELVEKVTDHYPNAVITRYRPSDVPTRSTEVGIVQDDESYTVFINPYNGHLLGKLKVKAS
ncbi:PepSY domain-containing protein [Bacillus alveayuensis]|jgi:uncharacterized iron-regulated membrane protein|uniref:PepSY domain-containing protein n=1 Tax=Aeribacillus alveayuensis TaxID=279215 RepID=UPI000A061C41|nr:PepSY domain-containing protein [Bacillus alveayuensis]